MIQGIGTDICDIRRIQATCERQGERFVRKVLSDAEFAVWQQRSARWPQRGIRYLATRFSAKEAFSKAIGLGMRMPMTWRRCEIANLPSGQPVIVLHGELKDLVRSPGVGGPCDRHRRERIRGQFCRGRAGLMPLVLISELYMHAPLIIDVAGFSLTTADRQRLAHPLVGGVILFGRNWQGREQLTTLCRQIKAVRPDLLIAVDHEGGRVQRFRTDGFTHLPPMAALGAMWTRTLRRRKKWRAPRPCAPAVRPRRWAMCWAPSCARAAWI